ncbi:hypothetical protein I4U23_030812 [Adineta vaga]|nr:hypothetical protein I4U23_030812 [Adineta vaga]
MENDPESLRTIRFCNEIDIREIPNKDYQTRLVQNGIGKKPSQESKETCCPKIFKTKQNIIIGIVLICVIVGTVGRILLSEEDTIVDKNSRTYNESCINECDRRKDLYCNNNRCQCDYLTKYWDMNTQTCVSRRNYSQTCKSNNHCLSTLICSRNSSICKCSYRKYYNPILSQCVNRSTFGQPCDISVNSTCLLSLSCNLNKCICPTGKKWLASKMICITSA